MQSLFKYRAFISYSHRDKAWGDWLHKSLESYRIPKRIVGQTGRDGPIPQKLFPVFRDREELPTSSSLSSAIQDALADAAYLIVICSPNAARSRWVNEEILAFKRMGKEDRILALIVTGEPNASAKPDGEDAECFSPALRFLLSADGQLSEVNAEPIAADARAVGDGKENAKLKLIAGILGIGFDVLKQRELEAARRRARIAQAIAGSMIGLALAASAAAAIAYLSAVVAKDRLAKAQIAQTNALIEKARGLTPSLAIQVLLRALPRSVARPERVFVPEAASQLATTVDGLGTASELAMLAGQQLLSLHVAGESARLLTYAGAPTTLTLWGAKNGDVLMTQSLPYELYDVDLAPDGNTIAFAPRVSAGQIQVLDVATKRLSPLISPTPSSGYHTSITAVRSTFHGQVLATYQAAFDSQRTYLMRADSQSGAIVENRPLSCPDLSASAGAGPNGVAFLSQRLGGIWCNDGSIALFHPDNPAERAGQIKSLGPDPTFDFTTFAVPPDGSVVAIAGSSSSQVLLIDGLTGQLLAKGPDDQEPAIDLDINPVTDEVVATYPQNIAGEQSLLILDRAGKSRPVKISGANDQAPAGAARALFARWQEDGKGLIVIYEPADHPVELWDGDLSHPTASIDVGIRGTKATAAARGPAHVMAIGYADGSVALFDTMLHRALSHATVGKGRITGIWFSSDGKLLAVELGKRSVATMDAGTLQAFPVIQFERNIDDVQFVDNAGTLLTLSYGRGEYWDGRSGRKIDGFAPTDTDSTAHRVRWSEDGLHLAAVFSGNQSYLRIFDVKSGASPVAVDLGPDEIREMAFDPTSRKLALLSWSESLVVLNAETGKELWHDSSKAAHIQFDSTGATLLTSGSDQTEAFDATLGTPAKVPAWAAGVMLLGLSHDGSRALVVKANVASIIDTATNDLLASADFPGIFGVDPILPEILFDGTAVATGVKGGNVASITQVHEANPVQSLTALTGGKAVTAVGISGDGRLIAVGTADGDAKVIDAGSLKLRQSLTTGLGGIRLLKFSLDKQRLIVAGLAGLGTYDGKDWALAHPGPSVGANVIQAVAAAAGDVVGLQYPDETFSLWQIQSGGYLQFNDARSVFKPPAAPPLIGLSESGDVVGYRLVNEVRIFNAKAGKQRTSMPADGNEHYATEIRMGPAGKRMAVLWSDGSVGIVDTANLKEKYATGGPTERITAASFFGADDEFVALDSLTGIFQPTSSTSVRRSDGSDLVSVLQDADGHPASLSSNVIAGGDNLMGIVPVPVLPTQDFATAPNFALMVWDRDSGLPLRQIGLHMNLFPGHRTTLSADLRQEKVLAFDADGDIAMISVTVRRGQDLLQYACERATRQLSPELAKSLGLSPGAAETKEERLLNRLMALWPTNTKATGRPEICPPN